MVKTSAERLNGRLTHFISNNLGWKELNPIQEKAIPIILDGNDTLVIAPTASGKTEAVLLPVFSEIISNNLDATSVIYVAPLKALINDMFDRIDYWGNHFGLTATKWHGDVNKTEKDRYIKSPTDFLAITPESLEVILMNRNNDQKMRIFQNLKYIIIDEIHYFADSDRGAQLNSLINRISRYSQFDVQKIGLSATVGNPEVIAEWIDHNNPATIVKDDGGREFYYKVLSMSYEDLPSYFKKYVENKILFFCGSRAASEMLQSIFKYNIDHKNLLVHHSSIDKDVRENNEKIFKNRKYGFMFSTSTLELGIDIGNIDIVIHVEPPNNISSFLQRIGRSGRRSKQQKSIIIATELNILVALSELILKDEGKIESIKISKKTKDILFHQILSSIFERKRVNYERLYNELTDCYAFSEISKKEFGSILMKMDLLDFIRIDKERRSLTLDVEFEKKFGKKNNMNFYSVFCPSFEYKVKRGKEDIGTLDVSFVTLFLEEGSPFILAGKRWIVTAIDKERFVVDVVPDPSPKLDVPMWTSDGPALSYMISRKVFNILINNYDDKYLSKFDNNSKNYIFRAIDLANQNGFADGLIPVYINKRAKSVYIYTFAGDKANYLLCKLFALYYDIKFEYVNPFYAQINLNEDISIDDVENIIYNIEKTLENPTTKIFIDEIVGKFYKNKFINYLPKKDEIELKMDLLFDKEGLIDLVKNNTIYEMKKDTFIDLFTSGDKTKEKNSENSSID